MSSLAPYVPFYNECIQNNWGISTLGEVILPFLRPNNSTNYKTWDSELLLALQELSDLTVGKPSQGINHVMKVTKQRIDETGSQEELVTWMIARDVEEAVENVNEENLQREKQLKKAKEAEKKARKQAKEEQQQCEAEEKLRRDAEEREAEEQEKREEEEQEERMRKALEKARKGKKKVVCEEDDPNTAGRTPQQMAVQNTALTAKDTQGQDANYDSEEAFEERKARRQALREAREKQNDKFLNDELLISERELEHELFGEYLAEQAEEEETTSLSVAAGRQCDDTNARGVKRARAEDASPDAEDEDQRTSKRTKTSQDEQNKIVDEVMAEIQPETQVSPEQPTKKRSRKRGKKRRNQKSEQTEDAAASLTQYAPQPTPPTETTSAVSSQVAPASPTNNAAQSQQIQVPPARSVPSSQPMAPVTFEDNTLEPVFLAPEPMNLPSIPHSPLPPNASVEEMMAYYELEREAVQHRAHVHREMARAHMENARGRELLARDAEIRLKMKVLGMRGRE
jgi:hypothetical protein